MRLFIAIDISVEANDELLRVQKLLPKASMSLARQFHITLKFLGEVNADKVSDITNALKNIRFNAFELELSGIGCFPNKKDPRVIWVGLKESLELTKLASDIEKSLKEFGFEPEHKFRPHLTLARTKFIDDKYLFRTELDKINVLQVRFRIDSFSLYSSVLTEQGAVYEIIKRFGD